MTTIRFVLPVRRKVPTLNPAGDNWGDHKADLKVDFNNSCGYCDSYDGFRHTYFEVDHFIPKSVFGKEGGITKTQYDNLVYSCKFCNNHKGAKWPTQRINAHNENDQGFVDPCDARYEDHFYRTKDGGIMWRTRLGEWMCREAFKFDERAHGIKILWNLNRLRIIIDSLLIELNKLDSASKEFAELKAKIGVFSLDYYIFHKELIEYYE
jgi:hypothetical protein